MTNEKDREEAYGLPTHYDDGDLVDDIREKKHGSYGTEFDLDYPIACARVRQYCARIRTEAVKAERERCVNYAVSWMIANKNTECMDNTDVAPCVLEIIGNLSDAQEANNGTT